jgi:Protein of unknown function (DUF4019)
MRRLATVLLLAAYVIVGASLAYSQESDTKAAQAAVDAWLVLMDRQQYGATWDKAASAFKKAISQDKWKAAARSARMPFGALKSRTLKSTTATKSLPGAPDGEYLVFQFTTAFDQKAAAEETVAAVHDKDGKWRVGGYFIR